MRAATQNSLWLPMRRHPADPCRQNEQLDENRLMTAAARKSASRQRLLRRELLALYTQRQVWRWRTWAALASRVSYARPTRYLPRARHPGRPSRDPSRQSRLSWRRQQAAGTYARARGLATPGRLQTDGQGASAAFEAHALAVPVDANARAQTLEAAHEYLNELDVLAERISHAPAPASANEAVGAAASRAHRASGLFPEQSARAFEKGRGRRPPPDPRGSALQLAGAGRQRAVEHSDPEPPQRGEPHARGHPAGRRRRVMSVRSMRARVYVWPVVAYEWPGCVQWQGRAALRHYETLHERARRRLPQRLAPWPRGPARTTCAAILECSWLCDNGAQYERGAEGAGTSAPMAPTLLVRAVYAFTASTGDELSFDEVRPMRTWRGRARVWTWRGRARVWTWRGRARMWTWRGRARI